LEPGPHMNNKIVVIDDDKDILDIIHFILDEEGYEIVVYDRLGEIEEIAAHQPSLVLLDNKLAGVYSTNLCVELKSNESTKKIPVILVSASEDLEEIAKQCNADAFLMKPFDLKQFILMVKHHSDAYNSLQ
jgi:DNA-binding response OmpR family regulator